MSSSLEFEGKNVEAAARLASEKLKIPMEKLRYDVISYGSSGIFGLVGTRKARIRITPPPADSGGQEPLQVRESLSEREIQGEGDEDEDIVSEEQTPQMPVMPPELLDTGKAVLQNIVDAIADDARVRVEEREGRLFFEIEGGNEAILIGKRGQTLEAIQYLVEKILNKSSERKVRIQIDAGGYLRNRQESLKRLAVRLAEKAKRLGKPVTMGQMNAYDRRIVHLTLKDDAEVKTQSLGDGFYRKLVILPKRAAAPKRRNDRPETSGES